jgi:protein ImuB
VTAPHRVLVLRCPGWPAADEAASAARDFEPVVAVVERFCPKVEILRPGTCAIGVRGPARYFGGEQALAARLAAAMREAGFGCQIGVADGLFAAELAAAMLPPPMLPAPLAAPPVAPPRSPEMPLRPPASSGDNSNRPPAGAVPQAGPAALIVPAGGAAAFLAGQPVSALGDPELSSLLPRLGIATLGEFAALPAAEAASRFGAAGALAHRLARGLDPRPLAPRPPAADESEECDFDPPAEQSEPVVFAAKSLADRLHDRLAARGLACVRVQVLVRCADGREVSRFWRHDGLLSGLAVAERVRWQLDGWRDGSGGITLLRLIPDQLVRATGRQLGLWGDAVVSDQVARCAIRVQAMLGHSAVTRPVLAGGRGPAEQVLLVPFGDAPAPHSPADRPWPGKIPAPAPATVYPVPRPAQVTDAAGAAVSVTGRAQLSAPPARLAAETGPPLAIVSWAGPWPVTERWWDPEQARRQARFQFVTADGTAWLAVLREGRWLVEASYD